MLVKKEDIYPFMLLYLCQGVEFECYVSFNQKYTIPLQVSPSIQSTLKGVLLAYE